MNYEKFRCNASFQTLEDRRLLTSIAFPQDELFTPGIIGPYESQSADIDSDGRIDLVAAYSGTIVWFRNGENGFSAAMTLAKPSFAGNSIAVGDVDGDGDVDLLIRGDQVAWFENNSGIFSEHFVSEVHGEEKLCFFPITYCSTFLTDLDDDGDLDIFDGKRWHENANGAGDFVERDEITNGVNFVIAAVDMDQDQDIDLITSEPEGIVIYTNTGRIANRFERSVAIVSKAGERLFGPTVHDADGDNDIDIALLRDNTILLYENISGRFSDVPRVVETGQLFLNNLSFLDGDADFDQDIVVSANGIGLFIENSGQAEFLNPVEIGPLLFATRLADLDADGDLDFYERSRFFNLAWQENRGDGTIGVPRFVASGHPIQSITSADFDNNGLNDFLVWGEGHFGPSGITVHRRLEDGQFATQQVISRDFSTLPPIVADIDGDGSADVITRNYSSKLQWYKNDGTGEFADPIQLYEYSTENYAAADVDSDGDDDLLVAGSSRVDCQRDCGLVLLKNDNAVITEIPISATAPVGILFSDIDGDQDQDILAVYPNGTLEWFENTDAAGTFVRTENRLDTGLDELSSYDTRLLVSDFDGDGDQDAVVTGNLGDGVFLENIDGMGAFRKSENSLEGPFDSMAIADLDRDGDPDIVGTEYGHIFLLENMDGSGRFSSPIDIVSEGDLLYSRVNVDDFDLDGDLDIIVSTYHGRIFWYENRQVGDANDDGIFDSSDLVRVFQAGLYDRDEETGFDEGDWNGDGVFDSGDLVLAFQSGNYHAAARPRDISCAAALDCVFADFAKKAPPSKSFDQLVAML